MATRTVPASPEGLAAIAIVREQLIARGDGFNASVEERRAGLQAFAATHPPVEGVQILAETLGSRPALRITPPDPQGAALYLHGGAYVLGSAETHRGLAARYALASGLVFHALDYRLAPEHPYPAALDDALDAAQALAREEPDWVLAGDSAGGGLALALLVALRDRDLPLPTKAALSSPWVDLALTGQSIEGLAREDRMLSRRGLEQDAARYRGTLSPDDPLVSPLFADLAGLPPLFLQVGSAEILLDDSLRLHARVRAAGGDCSIEIWEGMTHAWSAFGALLPEAAGAIQSFGASLRQSARLDSAKLPAA